MPVGIGISFERYKEPTTPVAVLRESTVKDFNIDESFLTHDSMPADGTLTVRGKIFNLMPLYFYTLIQEETETGYVEKLNGRALVNDEQFRILLNGDYFLYKVIGKELVNLSSGNMVEGVVYDRDKKNQVISRTTLLADLEEGRKYILTGNLGTEGQAYTIIQSINGLKVTKDLALNSIIYNFRTATFQLYRGGVLQDYTQPVPYTFYCEKNIKLYEDDGVTPRVIPRSELVPFLPKEAGKDVVLLPNAATSFTIILNGQTNKTENVAYIFRELSPSAGFTWRKHPPFANENFQRINAFDSALFQRGDNYQGVVYRMVGDPPFLGPGNQYLIRFNQTISSNNTPLKWEKIDPSASAQKILEDKITLLESILEPIFTKATSITIKNKCTVIIDGAGDINIWIGAMTGDFFKISDPDLKLTTIAPSVVPETGYTINGATGPYSLSAIKADWEYDRNLFFRLDNNKNWTVGRL